MNPSDLDRFLADDGQAQRRAEPGLNCPSDQVLACYVAGRLPERELPALELHALRCPDCFELVKCLAAAPAGIARPRAATVPLVTVAARLLRRGLELLNAADVSLRDALNPAAPALGALRRAPAARTAEPATPLSVEAPASIHVSGPGPGLDEIVIGIESNGTARVEVRPASLPELLKGEILSLILEVDGSPREKRPFAGGPVALGPFGPGQYRLRLVGRVPGGEPREIAQALLELST